jgi:hypothetical protein
VAGHIFRVKVEARKSHFLDGVLEPGVDLSWCNLETGWVVMGKVGPNHRGLIQGVLGNVMDSTYQCGDWTKVGADGLVVDDLVALPSLLVGDSKGGGCGACKKGVKGQVWGECGCILPQCCVTNAKGDGSFVVRGSAYCVFSYPKQVEEGDDDEVCGGLEVRLGIVKRVKAYVFYHCYRYGKFGPGWWVITPIAFNLPSQGFMEGALRSDHG